MSGFFRWKRAAAAVLVLGISGSASADLVNENVFGVKWYLSANPGHECRFVKENGATRARNEHGISCPVIFRTGTEIEAPDWHITGTILDDGTIRWSNGTVWAREHSSWMTRFYLGHDANLPCRFGFYGKDPVAINERNEFAAFWDESPTVRRVPDWNIRGERQADGSWWWSNGTKWETKAIANTKDKEKIPPYKQHGDK